MLLARKLVIAYTLLLTAPVAAAFAQDKADDATPPKPQFQTFPADAQYTTGQVRVLYVGPAPNYYVQLSKMPQGVDYFRIQVDKRDAMIAHKLRTIQAAAEYGWQIGIYHQPRTTTNFVDADYVVAVIPAKEPK